MAGMSVQVRKVLVAVVLVLWPVVLIGSVSDEELRLDVTLPV